jgi:hypothetical protein
MIMPSKSEPSIPKSISEIIDLLSSMLLSAPTFVDRTGYFPDRSLASEFLELTEGLKLCRNKLGEERFSTAVQMSDQMRILFESDPEDSTGDSLDGRELILDLQDLLRSVRK